MIQMLHLKILLHCLHARQKSIMFFFNETNLIYIPMPMYNSIEYSDNFSDASRSLCQLKRDEVPANNADLGIDNNGNYNSQLFKYKVALLGKTADYGNLNSFVKKTKIVVPLEYLRNFWRSRNAIN